MAVGISERIGGVGQSADYQILKSNAAAAKVSSESNKLKLSSSVYGLQAIKDFILQSGSNILSAISVTKGLVSVSAQKIDDLSANVEASAVTSLAVIKKQEMKWVLWNSSVDSVVLPGYGLYLVFMKRGAGVCYLCDNLSQTPKVLNANNYLLIGLSPISAASYENGGKVISSDAVGSGSIQSVVRILR